MRIVYVVDLHDRFVAVADAISSIGNVDVLVIRGDLTNAGSPERVERAIVEWQARVPCVLAVAGNMIPRRSPTHRRARRVS